MHTASVGALPQSVINRSPLWLLAVAATTQILSGVLATQFGWGLAFAPWMVFVTIAALIWPRVGVYMLVTLAYVRVSLPGFVGIYPADVMTVVVVVGTLGGRMAQGLTPIVFTKITSAVTLVLAAFGLSLVVAFDPLLGFINWLRHLQLFALMLAVASTLERDDLRRLPMVMLSLTTALALWNIAQFVLVGGTHRVFGPTGPFFEAFLTVAIIQCASGVLLARGTAGFSGWTSLLLTNLAALVCTQSRTPMIQVVLTLTSLLVIAWRWSRLSDQPVVRRRAIVLLTVFFIGAVILFTNALPMLTQPSQRLWQAVEGRSLTLSMRLWMWKTGIQVFLDSPILGIGLAQVMRWNLLLPSWHLNLYGVETQAMGPHNDFINYLASTGIAGLGALLALFWRIIRIGARKLQQARSLNTARDVLVVWMPAVAIIVGFFLGPHTFYSLSGMLTAVYFAMVVCLDDSAAVPGFAADG